MVQKSTLLMWWWMHVSYTGGGGSDASYVHHLEIFVKMQILAPLVWNEARDSAFQPHSLEMLVIGIARGWGELLELCFLMERPIG